MADNVDENDELEIALVAIGDEIDGPRLVGICEPYVPVDESSNLDQMARERDDLRTVVHAMADSLRRSGRANQVAMAKALYRLIGAEEGVPCDLPSAVKILKRQL